MNIEKHDKYLVAVDDEKDLRFLFEHFFKDQIESEELKLIFTDSVDGCLENLAQINGEIVVLTDICMPDKSGIDLLKIISKDYPSVKVFLVSAYDKEQYTSDIKTYGAAGYISKPLEFNALKEKVLGLLDITH